MNAPTADGGADRKTVLLAILVAIVAAFALKQTVSVTLPVAFGIFFVCLFWPLQSRMARVLPNGLSVLVNVLLFLAVAVGFGFALWWIGQKTASGLEGRMDALEGAAANMESWLAGLGFELSGAGGGASEYVKRAGKAGFELIGGFTLTLAFLGLGLLETRDYEAKLQDETSDDRWPGVVSHIAQQMRRYFLVRTGIGALTGALCALGGYLIGLELWWLWGVLNFLLNYIPTLGSIIGVVPPVLYAVVQSGGDPGLPLAAFGVVGGVQLVMGNWIDPLVQGKYLSLSPMVVLFSVVFWGWVWGIVGALIGVPLTILVVLLTREFESTAWIATFLAEEDQSD